MIYCDKYLSLDSLVLTRDKFDATIEQLRSIRGSVDTLLSSKKIKEIFSTAILSSSEIDNLLNMMLRRIQLGKTPTL